MFTRLERFNTLQGYECYPREELLHALQCSLQCDPPERSKGDFEIMLLPKYHIHVFGVDLKSRLLVGSRVQKQCVEFYISLQKDLQIKSRLTLLSHISLSFPSLRSNYSSVAQRNSR